MAKRCCAILVGRPQDDTPVRRCGQIAVGKSDFCVVHRPDSAYYNALRRAFGEGWEQRIPGADDGLTPRHRWKGDKPEETPLPRPVSASEDNNAPETPAPAPPAKPARRSVWNIALEESRKRLQQSREKTGG